MDKYTIGIDLGGTNLRVAAYSAREGILARVSLRTRLEAGPEAIVADMAEAILGLIREHPGHSLAGIGVGTPGPLELPAGILHGPPNLPGWDNFDLRSALESKIRREVHIDSDANLAALAECMLGAGATYNTNSLCMVTLGTGVGNAIILTGKIWSGKHGMAGEAGHATVWPDGLPCNCGSRGCLELYASATGVKRMAEEAIASGRAPGLAAFKTKLGTLEAQDLCTLAVDGDRDALAIFDTVGQALGITLANLVNTLDLPLYLVGGGLAAAWSVFSPRMLREIESRSYVYRLVNERLRAQHITIAPAGLGSDSGLLGAALLPLHADAMEAVVAV